ncbi:MAG: N-acetyltransferase [Bryobacteraceae bacterium]
MTDFVPVSTFAKLPPEPAGIQEFDAAAPVVLRRAAMQDIPALLGLINTYARQGIMLPRTEFEMAENIRDFTVVFSGDHLAGCAALHFYGPTMGEIRSLAVDPRAKGQGFGRLLVEQLVREGMDFTLAAVFAFTYVDHFFQKLNFVKVERGDLPLKAWKDCLKCPKFQCCDEIAMVRRLS